MTSPQPIRAVCFDLWNTLAFTDHAPHPLVAIASACGIASRSDWRRILEEAMMTRPISGIRAGLEALARRLGTGQPDAAARRDLTLLWGAACNANRFFPDALPALDRLGRPDSGRSWPGPLKLGVISNTQSFDLDFLRREGLETRVDLLLLSCHEGRLKPDPAIFLEAARRLDLPPAAILMVGDSLVDDVFGAIAAGMRAALLRRDRPEGRPPGVHAPGPNPAVLSGLDGIEALLRPAAGTLTP